jgi:hypothetical protein
LYRYISAGGGGDEGGEEATEIKTLHQKNKEEQSATLLTTSGSSAECQLWKHIITQAKEVEENVQTLSTSQSADNVGLCKLNSVYPQLESES